MGGIRPGGQGSSWDPSQAAGPLKGGRRPRAGSWRAQDGDDLQVRECLALPMALGGKCELRKCQGRAGLSRDPVGLTSAAVPACPNGACLGGGRFSLPAGAHAKPKAGRSGDSEVWPGQWFCPAAYQLCACGHVTYLSKHQFFHL